MKRILLLVLLFLLASTPPALAWSFGDGVRYAQLRPPFGPHGGATDTDRRVPIFRYCKPRGERLAFTRYRAENSGPYEMRTRIYINRCKLDRLNAGEKDRRQVKLHEKAHVKGFRHYEGSPGTNAAYYPSQQIHGR